MRQTLAEAPPAPVSSQPVAVELHGLTKTFRAPDGSAVDAVRGIDLTIHAGEVVALLGPNGAGKTTTLDMVLGLTSPTSGGVETFGMPPRRAVREGRVAAVLQTGGLLRDLTVRETVVVVASTFGLDGAHVDRVLERTGLTALARRWVGSCSGGEAQRLRFALALLPDPDLLVLDEPTAGMDVAARRDFWAVMREEAQRGRAVVFATHYLHEAEEFAERTVLMAHGRVVADGPTTQVRDAAAARTVTARLPEAERGRLEQLLRASPGLEATSIAVQDGRITLRGSDSDALARLLLNQTSATDLEVLRPSLDDAFVALTSDHDQEENR